MVVIHVPVNPSFLLHDCQEHRLRFFLSTLDAVNGDIEVAPRGKNKTSIQYSLYIHILVFNKQSKSTL
jgi:hypothetical protein